ncbi:hypothetical protein J3E74DRAFT_478912 [Bipolaris maydis]|nr:hypothetical protein J3E74DRAFT_478912 [Bipolaris maydis]
MSQHYHTTTTRECADVGHSAASHHGVGDQFAVSGNAAQFNAAGQAEQYNFSGERSSMNLFIGLEAFKNDGTLNNLLQVAFNSRNIQNSGCVDSNMTLSRTQANEFLESLESCTMLGVPKSWKDLKWGYREHAVMKVNPFWLQPKFQTWCSKPRNTLRFVKGSYQNRSQIKSFCLDFIKLMEDARVPLLWALKPNSCEQSNGFSPERVLSYLIVQALTISLKQEKASGISERQAAQIRGKFQDASTLTDYIDLLCFSISISRLPEQGSREHVDLMNALSIAQSRLHDDGCRTVVKFSWHEKGKPVHRRRKVGRLVSSHFSGCGRARR